jgi:lipid-binding SYLF domain-containing protein
MRTNALLALAAFLLASSAFAAGSDTKHAKKHAKHEETRQQIDAMAAKSLERLFESKADAKALYEKAFGYAVFDTTKFALGVSGGGGHGVAVSKGDGARTYMRVGQVGIGVGLGGQNAQVIMFFENEKVFRDFVDKGWEADASASATAGGEGAIAEAAFSNGMAYWKLSDKGAMLNADIGGTKYWQADKLNR